MSSSILFGGLFGEECYAITFERSMREAILPGTLVRVIFSAKVPIHDAVFTLLRLPSVGPTRTVVWGWSFTEGCEQQENPTEWSYAFLAQK